MKKLLCFVCLCGLLAGYVQAVPIQSLGWWYEGDPGTTHQFWDFTPGYITYVPGDGFTANPEDVFNPESTRVLASISSVPFAGAVTWDGYSNLIGDVGQYSFSAITVNLEIPNYETLNPYKEIWVDIGNNVVASGTIVISAADDDHPSSYYVAEILPGQGNAEFGVRIWPNPYVEKIGFTISTEGAPTVLDYIHVDTICIPEPATVALLCVGALGMLRRKK